MPHRHHRSHDVYDDTQYAPHPSDQVTVHHYPSPSHHRRRRHRAPDHHLQNPDPFHPVNDAMALMERDFARAFESPFGAAPFGSMAGIMSSFDRMFDQFASASASASPAGNGTYYYESSTTTVGPDGRMRQETVRTEPDADGNPHTSRFVTEGDQLRNDPYNTYSIQPAPVNPIDDRVIVEEVEQDDDCLRPPEGHHPRDRHHAYDEERHRPNARDNHQNTTANWMKDKFNRWRSRR
ncbi:unnamed protein product [Agarophyton chilense]